jgi:hypothetical protein
MLLVISSFYWWVDFKSLVATTLVINVMVSNKL